MAAANFFYSRMSMILTQVFIVNITGKLFTLVGKIRKNIKPAFNGSPAFSGPIACITNLFLHEYIKWNLTRLHVLKAGAGANRIVKNKSPHYSHPIAK